MALQFKIPFERLKKVQEYTRFSTKGAELVLGNLPFVFFTFFLLLIYIANAHYSEKKVREIQKLEKEIKATQWKYNAAKANLMKNNQQTQVAEEVAPLGLQNNNTRTKRIIIE